MGKEVREDLVRNHRVFCFEDWIKDYSADVHPEDLIGENTLLKQPTNVLSERVLDAEIAKSSSCEALACC